jgi:predicted DNA-binding WGR domain protein
MGQTKRFLEKMYDENDALNEAHALLRQKCEELYCDDVEKNQQLKKMINEMVLNLGLLICIGWLFSKIQICDFFYT